MSIGTATAWKPIANADEVAKGIIFYTTRGAVPTGILCGVNYDLLAPGYIDTAPVGTHQTITVRPNRQYRIEASVSANPMDATVDYAAINVFVGSTSLGGSGFVPLPVIGQSTTIYATIPVYQTSPSQTTLSLGCTFNSVGTHLSRIAIDRAYPVCVTDLGPV